MQRIKHYWLTFSTLVLFVLPLASSALVAAQSADIQASSCAGAKHLEITSNPNNAACDNIGNGGKTANNIVKEVIDVLSALTGILAVIMIIYAGFRYVSSGGSDDAVKGAKNTILYAIIGLVIVAFAQIIVHFVLAKTHNAITAKCIAAKGNTHVWDSGPNAGEACKP
jgi:hypothetical protein